MSLQVEEKTLELALVKASGSLGVTQEDMEYKVIKESSGFLGLFGKKITIEAWRRRGKRPSGYNSGKPHERKEREKASTLELDDQAFNSLLVDLEKFCASVCSYIAGEKVNVSLIKEEDRLIFDIENDYIAAQMTKSPKIAEAIEHLLRKRPRHIKQELPFRIFVDAQNARKDREQELIEIAQSYSNKVHQNRKPMVLNYRNPYDRKIIHMALDKDKRVYTKSIGSGENRKLMILPNKDHRVEANV